MKYIIKGLAVFILLFFTASSNLLPDFPKTGYLAMEGTLKTHIFEDNTDSLSGPEIFELQHDNGLTIWFGRHIYKDVCMSGVCKMIRLWVFWDGAGNYLGFQIHDDDPLTKSDHTLFMEADYAMLDSILKDTASILETLSQEELIIVPDSIDPFEIDGYSAATQPALADVIVKDAVYTCHTLWHTVYGPSQKFIENILTKRVSNEYLTLMLSSQKPANISWAIKAIEKQPVYHEAFHMQIMDYIKSQNTSLSIQALDYFLPPLLEDITIQHHLIQLLSEVNTNIKYEILWKFIEHGNTDDHVVLSLLKIFNERNMEIGMYNLILKLITPEQLEKNEEIFKIINTMSEHENVYISNLSRKLLDKME